jgi:hypothetical protein
MPSDTRPPHPSTRPVAQVSNTCPACGKTRVATIDPDAAEHCTFELDECWIAAGLQPPAPGVDRIQELRRQISEKYHAK